MVNNTTETSTQPDINFYGILEDHVHTASVESILIGGRYESIPVYQHIKSDEHDKNHKIDPKQNKTLINLQDIKSISLHNPENPTASSIQINNKTYIEIIVESVHGTKKKFLIESTRKITCKEIDKGADIKEKTPSLQNRDISFLHVKKLNITGYKSNYPYQAPQITPISKESSQHPGTKQTLIQEKESFKNNAAELLHAIEENVKNLPYDNASAFQTMKSTISTLLKSLRDQLQKFLDMIK